MRKLNETDFWAISDNWIFMDIRHFWGSVDDGYIRKCDGSGEYVYSDKDCNLYVDNDNYINFDELLNYNYYKLDDFVKNKSTEDYHLIGVFWFNK